MSEIITFGEVMLRLMPEDGHRLLQTGRLEATFGGGEANVAVSLANFGRDVTFVTALPENEVGQAAINAMRYFGVCTAKILRQGERIGVYYVEKGQAQRASKVIYDRKNSAIATSCRADYNWEQIFAGARWFHFTGITPALSDELAQVCMDACRAAKNRGVTVSCDLNYRKNLWSTQKARAVMRELMPFVDVCIANEEDAEKVLGIHAAGTDVSAGVLSYAGYEQVAASIAETYGCRHVAITLRTSISANDNQWAGMLFDGASCYFSKNYDMHIFDRIGGGDSFGAGLISSLLRGDGAQDAIEFAVAASCLKHSIQGDFNRVSVAEVEALVHGSGTGRVQR